MEAIAENDDDLPPQQQPLAKLGTFRGPSFSVRLAIVGLVYTLQGASLEFLQYSVLTELLENGATNSQLAVISIMDYPWCLKLFWAPLQDALYLRALGRRKTWVLGTLVLLSIVWGLLSFWITDLVDNVKIMWLTLVGVSSALLLTSQDVSMDGWIVKLSENEQQMATFSWLCSFGYSVGGLVSFTLYIWLSSEEWCKSFLGVDHAILTAPEVVAAISVSFIVATFLVGMIPESRDAMELNQPYLVHQSNEPFLTDTQYGPMVNEEPELDSRSNLRKVLNKVSLIVYNKNLLFLALFLFFSELGFAYFDDVGYVVMLANGVSSNTYALYWLVSAFFEGTAGYIVQKYCPGHQMKIYAMSWIIRIADAVYFIVVIYLLDRNMISENQAVFHFGAQFAISDIAYAMKTVPLLSFFTSICESQVEGTYIAFLTSIIYSASIWPEALVYTLSDHVSATILMAGSIIYDVLLLSLCWKRIMSFQILSKQDWALKKQ